MSFTLLKTTIPFGVSFAYSLALQFPTIPVFRLEYFRTFRKWVRLIPNLLNLFMTSCCYSSVRRKGDQLRHRSSSSDSDVKREKDIEGLGKELANYGLQIEEKDSAHMEALHQLEHYKKTTEELSVLLNNSELERDRYKEEYNEVKNSIDELESKMKGMVDQLSETTKIREQLSCVLNELEVTQADLLDMESQLAVAKDLELKAITQAEMMEVSSNREKERSKELLGRISDLHDAILISKHDVTEAENEKCRIVSEKDAEMETLKEIAYQAQEEMEDLRKLLETIQELENQIVTKTVYIDSLQAKLDSMENASLNGGIDLNQIKQDLEFKEKKISDQAFYIEALETELKRLKHEVENAQVEIETLKAELVVEADEISMSPAEDFNQLTTESANENEVEALKKQLKVEMTKIGSFRNRAEQAATRAEAAEKAKAKAEDRLRKWQQQKQRRKAALAALREESAPKQFNPPTSEKIPTEHQPLGKILNLKF